MTSKKRVYYLDLIRIIACFSVIFNHTGSNGFTLFSFLPPYSFGSWVYAGISVLTRCNVPLFFMISGATLLGKDEPLKKTWMRILKMALIIIVFSGILCLRDIKNGAEWTLFSFLQAVFSYNYNYTYWYLYYYIGFLIVLPVLRSWVKNLEDKYFIYMFFVVTVFMTLNTISEGITRVFLNNNINVNWFLGESIMFPFFGYFLHHRIDREKLKKYLPYLLGMTIAFLLFCIWMTLKREVEIGYMDESTLVFHTPFRIVFASTIFALFRYFFEEKNFSERSGKIISYLSSLTLGIYLLHEPVIHMSFTYKIYDVLAGLIPGVTMIPVLLICLYTFLVAGTVTAVLKLLPGFRKLI